MSHTLQQFPEKLVVVALPPGAEVPSWAESSSIFSITATALETSIICASRSVPKKVNQAGPFTAFAVEGPLDEGLVGMLHGLLAPMVEAEIPVFTVSTYLTDWILVPIGKATAAAEAWTAAGNTVEIAVPVKPGGKS